MIKVSKLNGTEYYINADIIEFIEATPDTLITLASGKKLVVLETVEEVVQRVIEYRRKVFSELPRTGKREPEAKEISQS
jgi:flagellar protein FlbD